MSDGCIFMFGGGGGGCGRRGEESGELLKDDLMVMEDGTVREDAVPPPALLLGMLLPMAPYTPPGAEKSWSSMGWFSPWGVSGVPGGPTTESSDWLWSRDE